MDKEIRFNPDSFQLVQTNTRIMDKKLESKPTTFAKDAFIAEAKAAEGQTKEQLGRKSKAI